MKIPISPRLHRTFYYLFDTYHPSGCEVYLVNLFIYLFLAALGLLCCTQAFCSCGERGLLFVVVRVLLIAVASRCGAQALGVWASVVVARRLSSCGVWAPEHRFSSCGARA